MRKDAHIKGGYGAPTEAPPTFGAHYVDVQNKKFYMSIGTGTVNDWIPLGEGGGGLEFDRIVDNPIVQDGYYGWMTTINPADVMNALVAVSSSSSYMDEGMIYIDSNTLDWKTGEGFYIRNSTGGKLTIEGKNYAYLTLCPNLANGYIPSGGIVAVKNTGDMGGTSAWLVYGDFTEDADTPDTPAYPTYWWTELWNTGGYNYSPSGWVGQFVELREPSVPDPGINKANLTFDSFDPTPTNSEFRLFNNSPWPMTIDPGYYSQIHWACAQESGQTVQVKPRGVVTVKCTVGDTSSKEFIIYGDLEAVTPA